MMKNKRRSLGGLIVSVLLLTPIIASAHTFSQTSAGLLSGLIHPLGGWDHVTAMIAVGLWAKSLGGNYPFRLTVSFLTATAVGALLVSSAVALPVIEAGVMASLLILGLFIALNIAASAWVAGGLVALFGVFHGFAHASDVTGMFAAWSIIIGLLLSSAALIVIGVWTARGLERAGMRWAVRSGGAGIGAVGATLLLQSL